MLLSALLAVAVLWTAVVVVMVGLCMVAARGDRTLVSAPRPRGRRRFRAVASL